ncbi:hypothetical protein HJA_13025 [Hyphomonas jannaschiana VP2]|uniref:Uncharacterized protein n=2 Tax=Hyphomonas jannaschiana TaxID=86 RepID=A0A059FA88_9PROT|nr:hypothetical protein HJA_13025 [Hyphomonas jannaschiana VP2]
MSSALLSNLPRFDQGDQTHPAEQLKRMLGQMQEAAARTKPAPEPTGESVEEEVQSPEPVDLGPSLAEIESLAGQLSAVLGRIENEARDQAMQVTQALAARLFPELSQRFLAAEIAQHLPQLIPASVPSIEIRARQEVLNRLEPFIAHDPSLSERCKMTPAATADEPRVQVSWQTGGVTFDFEGLLAACLSHLDPSHTMIEE